MGIFDLSNVSFSVICKVAIVLVLVAIYIILMVLYYCLKHKKAEKDLLGKYLESNQSHRMGDIFGICTLVIFALLVLLSAIAIASK